MEEADIREILSGIEDPDLGTDIVSENLVSGIDLDGDAVTVGLALEAAGSPTEAEISDTVREALESEGLSVTIATDTEEAEDDGMGVENLGPDTDEATEPLPDVSNVIAVASGKGGVGKSTVSVNLAAGLADRGADVAIFDADMYGPNVPRMLGVDEQPRATSDEEIVPVESHGMGVMSLGLMLGDDDPVIWRGAMVTQTLTQLVDDVKWGDIDHLVIDLPPGTGDTQLTLLQSIPITGSVIVTTPQEVALEDARRGLQMFAEHDTPVLGIVENMSTFVCPDCGSEHDIFGSGGGERFAEEKNMPFLGSIPLDPAIRSGGDEGAPIVMADDGGTSESFQSVVKTAADMVGILNRQNRSQ
ncbi:Mrp/NBP35 family ATP-binding protein [Halodesulfurarchaeum sp.]|uniref:Mrp/NBP35 family ATP-binding protein n=1 Tax=Halodesulfurarchaeum sp. TaxID=1980530 RepID=UPI001BC2A4BA|nr:Mrp/NBP35 family ATP-binding protein [Halodesulfurarchaeum sp.]